MSIPRAKKKRLEAIRDEVNDFHPLLGTLLEKLPHVRSVEYTHGPDEKGADFVFQRYDPTIDESFWVGVVVKVGKIHLDIADVERQIEECFLLSRNIGNPPRRVVLNECWVIASQNITNGAKAKIAKKFGGSRILFFDQLKLTAWIDDHMPYYWHELPGRLGLFLQKTWDMAHLQDDRKTLGLSTSDDFYIELDITRIDNVKYGLKKPTRPKSTTLEKEIPKSKVLLLEGQMGGGKSKIIRETLKTLSTPETFSATRYLPILVTYSDLLKKYDGSLEKLVDKSIGNLKTELRPDVETLVFVDGVDEVIDGERKLTKLEDLVTEANGTEGLRLVIASRPLAIIDENPSIYRKVNRYKVEPLGFSKLMQFVEKVCSDVGISSRLREDLKNSDLFKQLPHSPIAAILLSRILSENPNDLPSNLTELYSKALELMLGRWDISKDLTTQKEYEAVERVLGQLSRYMIENGLNRVAKTEVREIFRRHLIDRNLELDNEELLDKVLRRSDVIVERKVDSTITFNHRSFAEFLYAKDLFRRRSMTIDERVFDPYWQNTFFFYLGLLKDCPEEINELMAVPAKTERDRWTRAISFNEYFLAGNHSPYYAVEENLYKLFEEMAELFFLVKENKSETKLQKLPIMQSLWLVQYLVRQSYSYRFFKKAMQATALRLSETVTDKAKLAYSLFFIGVVCIDLDEDEPFQFLLESVKEDDLPLSIAVALECEHKASKQLEHSPLLKKNSKRLRKLAKTNSVGSKVREFFEKPAELVKIK